MVVVVVAEGVKVVLEVVTEVPVSASVELLGLVVVVEVVAAEVVAVDICSWMLFFT